MLRLGNNKLGNMIYQWSIPSGDKSICIGASKACLKVCYAMRNHYLRPSVRTAMARNHELSKLPGFDATMGNWVRGQFAKIVRIHASGDFYSSAYVRKWIRVVKANRRVCFFAYTRSWRNKKVLEALKELAALPNVRLWFSCDSETGEPPVVPGVRRAYMMVGDTDMPTFEVDLVFRTRHSTVMKWVGNTLVCPYENGTKAKLTCSSCRLCFRNEDIPTKKEPAPAEQQAPVRRPPSRTGQRMRRRVLSVR